MVFRQILKVLLVTSSILFCVPISARVRIRGFTQEITFRDGIRDNFPSTDFANVERVEVLKGSASVLFGETEPGGIVNIVTKQPLSDPYYNVDLSAGNYAFYRSALDLSDPLNVYKTLLYRLNIAYENTGSFRDFINSQKIFIAPVIAWKLSENTDLKLFFEYNDRDYKHYSRYIFSTKWYC